MEGMKHQMALAGTILAGQPREVVDKFLFDVLKEVACHEVGHTLGLRHNFAGSFVYSLEEIKKRRATEEPTTGSIMDYNPVLFFKENTFAGRFITPHDRAVRLLGHRVRLSALRRILHEEAERAQGREGERQKGERIRGVTERRGQDAGGDCPSCRRAGTALRHR